MVCKLDLQCFYRVFVFTGLDYWTGLLDWTTGLTFELTFELFLFLSMINIAVVLLAKVNLGVLGKWLISLKCSSVLKHGT